MHIAKLACIAAAVYAFAAGTSAQAASTTRTLAGQAGGFVDGGLIPPHPTVDFSFEVTFDPDVSTGYVASPVGSYSGTLALPDYGPWVWQYDSATRLMTIGDKCVASGTGCVFTVSSYDAIFTFNLTNLDAPKLAGMVWRVPGTYATGGGNTGTFRNTTSSMGGGGTTSVPEPGTLALLALGLVWLAGVRRRVPDAGRIPARTRPRN